MTIDLVLISLQALFLCFYGVEGVTRSVNDRKVHWVAVGIGFLCCTLLCFFLRSFVKSNIQLFILLLLMLDYLFFLLSTHSRKFLETVFLAGIVFMSYASLYFRLELREVWLAVPFVVIAIIGLIHKWPDFLVGLREYFLKAGALLTLLFLVEPVVLSSVQQNLKPVATIPTDEIINQQNFLLIGVLFVLMLAGFFWKEKSRL